MRSPSSELVLNSLYDMIEGLEDGARLPTVRDLMKSFRVSQAAVQEAFNRLRDEGLVTSRVGRGTYVVKGGETSGPIGGTRGVTGPESLLILSNSSMNERCLLVQSRIVAELSAEGGKVVQLSYHDTDHLLDILASVPRFEAAILQSHYENIPVRLLDLMQRKTKALVIDGHTVSGVDVDRVGTDWEEALGHALDHLTALGHRRIGLVSLDTQAQPILAVRRAIARIDNWRGAAVEIAPPFLLKGVRHPTQGIADALRRALEAEDARGGAPCTALVFVGISDAAGIRETMQAHRARTGRGVSAYLLGHIDVASEHLDHFTMAGSSQAEAAGELLATIRRRLANPSAPPQIAYLRCTEAAGASTAPPE